MTDTVLLNQIAYLYYLYKNYTANLVNKYFYGTICEKDDKKLIIASMFIEEIENYYNDCSCLEEEDICEMIAETKKLLL